MLGIEYCHLQVRGKTLGITVKERKCNDHIYPAEVHRDSFISVQFQVNYFNFSSQLYDIYFVNIYLNILKYIKKNLYFCQSLEFVVWCLLNCLLLQIMLHKFAEMSLSLSLSLCVMSTPSHCYAFMFCAFYLPKSKKCPGHRVCKCVCVCVRVCAQEIKGSFQFAFVL